MGAANSLSSPNPLGILQLRAGGAVWGDTGGGQRGARCPRGTTALARASPAEAEPRWWPGRRAAAAPARVGTEPRSVSRCPCVLPPRRGDLLPGVSAVPRPRRERAERSPWAGSVSRQGNGQEDGGLLPKWAASSQFLTRSRVPSQKSVRAPLSGSNKCVLRLLKR